MFSVILQSRVKEAVNDVQWILSTDATAVTGRMGTIKLKQENFLIGHDHNVYEKTPLVFVAGDPGLLVLEDGTINGLENAKRMIKLDMISAASQMNIIVLTPLIDQSFNYCLLTHPIGNMFKSQDLEQVYADITSIAKDVFIKIISLAGDGDNRLRSLQWQKTNFPHEYIWITKEEFPVLNGLNKRGQIPMQDLLHDLKKLRNNTKYLSTKILLFADPQKVTLAERYTYAASWDIIVYMYENNVDFREQVSRSCIEVKDKQDPSLVTELCFTFQMFYNEGFHGMGLYLEMVYFLFTAFYDRSITPADRMMRASAVKTIISLWREEMNRLGVNGIHFVTLDTYKDVLIAAEGLIWYLLHCTRKVNQMNAIVPWFFTSDGCEQLFAWLRTGMRGGRHSNLDGEDITTGLSRRNKSLELDAAANHLLEPTVARTRGKTLIPVPNPKRLFLGKDTSVNELKDSLREGVELGKAMVYQHCKFTQSSIHKPTDYDKEVEEDENSEEEISSEDEESEDPIRTEDQNGEYIKIGGRVYHKERAKEDFLNRGRSRMPAQARSWRVQSSGVQESNLTLNKTCKGEGCVKLTVGDKVICSIPVKNNHSKKRMRNQEKKEKEVFGIVFFMSVQISSFFTQKSSVNHRPVDNICIVHDNSYTLWLKSNEGGKFFKSRSFVKHSA